MSAYCDGVIVGSAIVKIMEQYGSDAPEKVAEFTSALSGALGQRVAEANSLGR